MMRNRNLYLCIVGSVTLIVLLSLVGSLLLITGLSYFLSVVCLLFILLITWFIIWRMNGLNRRMAFFFGSLRNGDTTVRYPRMASDSFERNLYAEMNRVVALFDRNRNEMEEERLYYESVLRVMTHEIRNSITPIRSLSADLLEHSETYEPELARESLKVICDQADNLSAFLDAYHRLTHLPEPEYASLRIADLFRKIARLLAAESWSGRVRFEAPDDLVIVADQNLVLLALINLLRNASRAIEGLADGAIVAEAFAQGKSVYITIADNGPGIPPERLSAIFTPFYSTKPGGSGIGLSIARRIMRLHGGELTVESHPGIRTVFRMSFVASARD